MASHNLFSNRSSRSIESNDSHLREDEIVVELLSRYDVDRRGLEGRDNLILNAQFEI